MTKGCRCTPIVFGFFSENKYVGSNVFDSVKYLLTLLFVLYVLMFKLLPAGANSGFIIIS